MKRKAPFVCALVIAAYGVAAAADEPLPKVPEKFEVAGHTAMVYAAPQPAPGQPWVWYAPTIKGLSLVGRRAYFEGFLNAGISIAGFDLGEVHGDADAAVPYDENTGILKQRYEAGGGPITVKVIVGEGHQATPSFFECPELIEFVLKQAKVGAP